MLGTTISRYQVVEKLGEGGMGAVYKAWDTHLDRYVALKVLAEEAIAGGFRSRFVREAKTAASLNHPNIAHVYEVGDVDGTCFIAMEYIDGETLRQKMDSAESGLTELLGYLLQTANALGRAHAKGVIHCDLKPENIMVTREGLVKVLDFGLARLLEGYGRERARLEPAGRTQTSFPLWREPGIEGTIGYMSPEQAESKKLTDGRSDIFSFGCILFEIATRTLPFAGDTPVRALHSLIYDPAPPLAKYWPEAPPELQSILDLCLEKDPSKRCSTIEEVGRALETFLQTTAEGRKILERPEALPRQPEVHRVRKRKFAIIAAISSLLLAVGLAFYTRQSAETRIDSVAVIPFANARGTPQTDFLSDGISEGLINALAQLPDLKVIARSSSFKFKGENIDIRRVARTLGVRVLVTGRLAELNGQLRITAELVKGNDGSQLWGAQYRAAFAEVADIQAQIVREIAQRVRSHLTENDRAKLARAGEKNSEAYELLLRGRYEMRLYNPRSTQKAVEYYQEALALDPGFAMANAELAYSYRLLSGAGILKPSETLPLAEAAARRALAADPDLAQAHAALADIRKDQWDWTTAEHEYRRAVVLNPNLASAHNGFANYLSLIHKYDEAFAETARAHELDPIGVPTAIETVAVYYNARQYDKALDAMRSASKLDPSAPALWTWAGIVNGGSGKFPEAIAAYKNALRLGDHTAATQCNYGYSLARSGSRDQALQILHGLRRSGEFIPPTALAVLYTGLNEKENAIQSLMNAYKERDPLLQYIGVESQLNALRDDERFQDLLAKIGLPR
jgi:serine/threonine protein kinase/Tfp pilus assembly protein PilF